MTDLVAPVYRYFTADLLSNEILAEIPFREVSYDRAIKGAGEFSGRIAVTDETDSLDLYNSTMPGNTALFVLRDDVCVWGGIIWTRNYDVVGRSLTVSGSEFTSYFYSRRIWKTWNHEFGGQLTVNSDGTSRVVLDYGTATSSILPRSTVHLQFYNSARAYKYNGYYTIGEQPAPTSSSFTLENVDTSINVTSLSVSTNVVTIATSTSHHYEVGDLVYVDIDLYPQFTGYHTVTEIDQSSASVFRFIMTTDDLDETQVTGSSTRSIPPGTYTSVTITTRTDTYQYIRGLIDAVFSDFVGIDFPNTYVEPGLSYNLDIVSKKLSNGVATIRTQTPHGLSIDQAVQIADLGAPFNGEHRVTSVPTETTFTYSASGTYAQAAVAQQVSSISAIEASLGIIKVTTTTAHGYTVGQTVQITTPLGYAGSGMIINGSYTVTSVPSSTTFTYDQYYPVDLAPTTFSRASATVGSTVLDVYSAKLTSNNVTITTASSHTFNVNDSVTVAGVSPYYEVATKKYVINPVKVTSITSSSRTGYDVTLVTPAAHGILPYEQITVAGSVQATFNGTFEVKSVTSTSVTYTSGTSATVASAADTSASITVTNRATLGLYGNHYLQAGDTVEVSGLAEQSDVSKVLVATGSLVTLTTKSAHGFYAGDSVTVSGLEDSYTITSRSRAASYTTLTTSAPHNLVVGDDVTVSGIYDSLRITQYSMQDGIAKIYTSVPHGAEVNGTIEVSGLLEKYIGTATVSRDTSGVVTLELPAGTRHNFVSGQNVKFVGLGVAYLRTGNSRALTGVDGNKLTFNLLANPETETLTKAEAVEKKPTSVTVELRAAHGPLSGVFSISEVTDSTITFSASGNDILATTIDTSSDTWWTATNMPTVLIESNMNGTHTLASDAIVSATQFKFFNIGRNISEEAVTKPVVYENTSRPGALASVYSRLNRAMTVKSTTAGQVVLDYSGVFTLTASAEREVSTGVIRKDSAFTGSHKVALVNTAGSESIIQFYLSNGPRANIDEETVTTLVYVKATGVFNKTSATITSVDRANNQFTYVCPTTTHGDIPTMYISGYGKSIVRPMAIASTYGPFPANSNIDIEFSTAEYSGQNILPTTYRGFELTSVGEALDAYSDSINGFEYRIDCYYDKDKAQFRKRFMLIPINFPDPPAPGQVSPVSRFGAERYVFEYPGNIATMSIEESARNSSTRFFVSGSTDLGADAGPNISVASDLELLNGMNGRRWPLLDDDETTDVTDNKEILYAYAKKYMTEARPPDATISIEVNGSIEPVVGSYNPGDWCSIVVNDRFILARLATDLEPRDTLLVRKIESVKVSVPDGTTAPEKVTLTVVPEWEVDKRG